MSGALTTWARNPWLYERFLAPALCFLAAQRAFIASDSRFRPAGVMPRLGLDDFEAELCSPPRAFAHRAVAAAESLARAAADILRRRFAG